MLTLYLMKPMCRTFICLIVTALSLQTSAQPAKTMWTAAWSPDNQYIAVGGDQDKLLILDAQSYQVIKSYPIPDVAISRVKWHPNLPLLAVVTQSDSFKAKILDVKTDQWTDLEGLSNSLRGMDWNYSGEYLAISEFDGEISIFDTNGKKISRFLADPKSVLGLDWHPTENKLVAVGSQIGMYDVSGDTLIQFLPDEKQLVMLCVQWHKSGEFFAVGDYGSAESAENKRVLFWNHEGELMKELEGSLAEYRNIRWNPKGDKLATASDALRLWSADGKLLNETKSSDDYLWGIDWSPDGTKIITSSLQGIISIWDESGQLLTTVDY